MHTPSDGLQDLLARLIGQAHELGSRGIYRGEPEPFGRISSGLYRQLYEIDEQYFDINSAQRRWIERARQYAPYLSDDDLLTQPPAPGREDEPDRLHARPQHRAVLRPRTTRPTRTAASSSWRSRSSVATKVT